MKHVKNKNESVISLNSKTLNGGLQAADLDQIPKVLFNQLFYNQTYSNLTNFIDIF